MSKPQPAKRDFWSADPPTLPLVVKQTAVYKQIVDAEGRHVAFCSLQETPERDVAWAEWLAHRVNSHEVLVDALRQSHACGTLRDDGSCDGCVVSNALALADKDS